MKQKIIVVAGPTASGKTALGIALAKAVDGEIISADSMQVYKNMPIATAAPTAEERAQAPHHLTEFLDPSEPFSVARWCALAEEKIQEIADRGHVPVIVGGTGLFIDSLVNHIQFEELAVDYALRESLMARDAQALYDELMRVDAQAAADIHPNNKKRVARALELYYAGVSKSAQNEHSRREETPYETLYFVLTYNDRQVLYDRINARVEQMLANGLVQEAKAILAGDCDTAAQAIGHKELAPYLSGECSLEQAAAQLKQETRHYAKRQMTWFRRDGKHKVFLPVDANGFAAAVDTAVAMSEEFINAGRKQDKNGQGKGQ